MVTWTIFGLAIGFPLGIAWDRWHLRERRGYRVPVRERAVSVAMVRVPPAGNSCIVDHPLIPAGCRCRGCGWRAASNG